MQLKHSVRWREDGEVVTNLIAWRNTKIKLIVGKVQKQESRKGSDPRHF